MKCGAAVRCFSSARSFKNRGAALFRTSKCLHEAMHSFRRYFSVNSLKRPSARLTRISSLLDFLMRCRLPGTNPANFLEPRFWTVLHYFRMPDDPPRRKNLQQGIHGKECEIRLQRVYKAQISSTRKDGTERSCLLKRLHSSARG